MILTGEVLGNGGYLSKTDTGLSPSCPILGMPPIIYPLMNLVQLEHSFVMWLPHFLSKSHQRVGQPSCLLAIGFLGKHEEVG